MWERVILSILGSCLVWIGSKTSPEEPIRIPSAPVVAPPAIPLGTPIDVTGDFVYPIDSDVPFKIFASPDGLVKITKEEGPVRYRGRFVGGSGKVETRVFKGKFLAFVEAAGKGDVEIIIDPTDSKDETSAIRQKLRVDNGTAPQPPPVVPDPPLDEISQAFQTAFNLEADQVIDKEGKTWTKADYVKKLAALYSGAAVVTLNDSSIKTYGDLFGDMEKAATFPASAMPNIRKAVGTYLDSKLKPTSLKVIDKTACKAEFLTVSDKLKNLKGVK